MKLTESSLRNPAGVAAGVALIIVFGGFCLLQLPVQLFPEIEKPQISIEAGARPPRASWRPRSWSPSRKC